MPFSPVSKRPGVQFIFFTQLFRWDKIFVCFDAIIYVRAGFGRGLPTSVNKTATRAKAIAVGPSRAANPTANRTGKMFIGFLAK